MPTALIRDVMLGDPMYEALPELYWKAGERAVELIRMGLEQAGLGEPRRVLDFACGPGRVMRYLKAEFSEAELTGCEYRSPGLADVDRRAETLGGEPERSARLHDTRRPGGASRP
jgi:cyclopropane fatty-acyl-phospholipid synthase-like methyltransferase